MQGLIEWNGDRYRVDFADPMSIAIPLESDPEKQPNAFGAPLYEAFPLRSGDFTGSIEAGAPVNFYNVRVNPHGNGTHTETVGHILSGDYPVHETLRDTVVVAELISVYPRKQDNGDRVISADSIREMKVHNTPALIVRSLPNSADKLTRKYTGTNPPYFEPDAMNLVTGEGVRHLLVDLPSVDREEDGGALKSHKMFWDVPKNPAIFRTITEMVFVDNTIIDGLYLLNLQIAPLNLDASPARPILFKMTRAS